MTTVIESEGFTKDVLPGFLKHDIREIISVAVGLGWRVHVSANRKSVTIISPDEVKRYHFSDTGRASHNLGRIRRDLIRHGEPAKVAVAEAAAHAVHEKHDRRYGEALIEILPDVGDPGTVEYEEESSVPEPERHIVSEEPMRAKASEGRGYRSQVSIERHWSDGTVDYKCADCDYTSTDRLAIRGHRVSHGKADIRPPRVPMEVPNASAYRPRKERIQALAEYLSERLQGLTCDSPEALFTVAQEALLWVHEQSAKGTRYAVETEPLTAEDTLNRIRALLDQGETMRQAERIADLERRLAEAEDIALKAEARAEQARATLRAFTEMANEYVHQGEEPQGA